MHVKFPQLKMSQVIMVQVHDNNKFGKVCIILGFVVGERGSYLGGLGEE